MATSVACKLKNLAVEMDRIRKVMIGKQETGWAVGGLNWLVCRFTQPAFSQPSSHWTAVMKF